MEAIIKTVTEVTDTFYVGGNLNEDSTCLLLPYTISKKDKWIDYKMSISKEKTDFNLKINDSYSLVIGQEKTGLFKPKKPFIEIITDNPYNSVKNFRTYQKIPEINKFSVGPMIGYGVGTNLKTQTFIGFGVQYSLFKF